MCLWSWEDRLQFNFAATIDGQSRACAVYYLHCLFRERNDVWLNFSLSVWVSRLRSFWVLGVWRKREEKAASMEWTTYWATTGETKKVRKKTNVTTALPWELQFAFKSEFNSWNATVVTSTGTELNQPKKVPATISSSTNLFSCGCHFLAKFTGS